MKTKLLLVGWDAADWSIIHPLLQEGKMPALAQLMNRGFHGKLASIQPMLSPLLWTSIATGVRPHKHKILNFVEVHPNGQSVRAVRGSSRKVKTFWEILFERGIRSNVIGWWPSHPSGNSGGVQVSNFFNRSGDTELRALDKDVVFPAELNSDYEKLRVHATDMTAQILAPFFPYAHEVDGSDSVVSSCAKIIADAASIQAAATEAMATADWDITAVYFDALDHFKHLAMNYHPPKSEFVSEEDFQKYRGIVEAGYRFHDMMLERLLELAGDDSHVLLVSDHGFATDSDRMSSTPQLPGGPAAEHFPYGILVGSGPKWKSQKVYGHSLLDICPAILHLFEAPIANNFDGRLPLEWWKQHTSPVVIDSYLASYKTEVTESLDENRLLRDLEALGYIDLPYNQFEAVRSVEGDTSYNEITSLLDGGMHLVALNISEKLVYNYPEEPRYAYQYLGILLMLNDERFGVKLDEIALKFPSASAEYFHGLNSLRTGFPKVAVQYFHSVLSQIGDHPGVLTSMGKALASAKELDAAIELLNRAVDQFPRWANAAVALAEVWEQKGNSEEVIHSAITAIQRSYYLPIAHALIAKHAVLIEEWEVAENAFRIYLRMNPNDVAYKKMFQEFLLERGRPEEAREWETKDEPVQLIVSGWPRSGTSMMMQLLNAGGYELFTDFQREPDESNPKGYFEHEAINRTHLDATWLEEADCKVAKVLMPQLMKLPSHVKYIVLWMERSTLEIVMSQEIMMGKSPNEIKQNFPFGKSMQIESDTLKVLNWVDTSPNVTLYKIKYSDFLTQTESAVERIVEILSTHFPGNKKLDKQKMMNSVDPELYRSVLI